jgi:hypothetical protein
MFTIEMLDLDWDDRENPDVVHTIPAPTSFLGEANMIAKSALDDTRRTPPNAYRIRDEAGDVVLRSWVRAL